MLQDEKVNVLLVDDQPAKLLAYETVLHDLGENLIKASSAREALATLLKTDVAILLIDVCMPELDGFKLAAMIREHPRFQQTAIIFVSAIHMSDIDRIRGYEMGAVDYVPVPVIPEVLRAKVRVFAELFRKTRQLEQLNADLERRVAERTAELEASNARLRESERRRSLALAAGQMGSWDWNLVTGECQWDAGQYRIFGVSPGEIELTVEGVRPLIHPEDLARIEKIIRRGTGESNTFQTEARIVRPDGQTRWCICAAAMTSDTLGNVTQASGVTIDITELKEAEARRSLLVREVDHRARNALAIVQSIVRMTKSNSIDTYVSTVEGRIAALSTAHALLAESRWEGASLNRLVDEELAPYRSGDVERIAIAGPAVFLKPETAQIVAMVLHELCTNAAKYGALSDAAGKVRLHWKCEQNKLSLQWEETGGPRLTSPPTNRGYGSKVIIASIQKQLGGTATFDWRPQGLSFTMEISIGDAAAASQKAARTPRTDNARLNGSGVAAKAGRVLLVEDEALVGMMMTDFLRDIGFHVVGPFGCVSEAIDAIDQEQLQAAVLDINLRGELIYDLADELTGRGVPIVFVTGYGADAVDRRFADFPVLQKPVDSASLRRVLVAPKTN
ncbi:MAG: response regulator [Xanthobacteraceae bacterium]|nr:response regulator [Xanthobacteraceae bacterium]